MSISAVRNSVQIIILIVHLPKLAGKMVVNLPMARHEGRAEYYRQRNALAISAQADFTQAKSAAAQEPATTPPAAPETLAADATTTAMVIAESTTVEPAVTTMINDMTTVSPAAGTTAEASEMDATGTNSEAGSDAAATDEDSIFDDGTILGIILGIVALIAAIGCLYAVLRSEYGFTNQFSASPQNTANVPLASSSVATSMGGVAAAPGFDTGDIDRRPSYAERRRSRVASNSPAPGVLAGLEAPTDAAELQITPRGRTQSSYAARRTSA
jgi:hypothetical protein